MKKLFSQLWTHYRDSRGNPATLEKWAEGLSPEEKSVDLPLTSGSIRLGDVFRWDTFGADHQHPHRPASLLEGFSKGSFGHYESISQYSPELAHWAIVTENPGWTGTIQDIQGLSSSKSDLSSFASLEAFATTACAAAVADVSLNQLKDQLRWPEVRIAQPQGTDSLCQYDWDGRLFLSNQGGSHHFAAARHLAGELETKVPLTGTLRTVRLNPNAVEGLCKTHEIFALKGKAAVSNPFHDGMASMGATYFFFPLPAPRSDTFALLLPRHAPSTEKVAALLAKEGFLDLGKALQELVAGIHRHPAAAQILPEALPEIPEPSLLQIRENRRTSAPEAVPSVSPPTR